MGLYAEKQRGKKPREGEDDTMPGLLGPTNPIPGYDNTTPVKITPPTPNDTSIQNIVDPTKIVRTDGRTEQQDAGNAALAARYESNFMTFVQRLRNMPDVGDMFLQVMQGQGLQVTSGLRSGYAVELAQFMEFLQMDETKLLPFLQEQMKGGARFSGQLFQILRNAYASSPSPMVQTDILQFLRKYSDFASTPHLEGKMQRTLDNIARALPSRWSEPMTEASAKVENLMKAGDRKGALQVLKEQVFPLVSRYVSLTHDHGRARSQLSLLTLDMARYENSAPEGVLLTMRHLANSGVLPERLADLPDKDLMQILKDTNFFRTEGNSFADNLAKVANKALKGEGGIEQQEAFRNIMSSILLNESVYMPLNHIMLPLEWNERLMFSEIWVDPDADSKENNIRSGDSIPLRMLIKMDIEGLGAFDLVVNAQGEDVSLQLACPESIADLSDKMSDTLDTILKRNGLRPNGVSVAAMKRPLAISEVFPKIFERTTGVNVKI